MARALTAVGGLLAVALLILALAVYLGRDEGTIAVDSVLAEDITRAIGTAEERGEDVDLRKVANFEWDELVIADRDVTRAQLSRELGHPWKGDLQFGTGDLLIFLRDDGVERFADYRGDGRFEGIRRPIARLHRDAAVLRVRGLVIRPPPS